MHSEIIRLRLEGAPRRQGAHDALLERSRLGPYGHLQRPSATAQLYYNGRDGAVVELRLTMARDVPKKTFVDALAEQITPRAGAPQSDTFAAAITGGLRDPTPEGSTTTIRLDPDGTISVLDDTGLVTAHVVVPAVCDAFLDIYLGADGISPTTLEAVKAGLEKF